MMLHSFLTVSALAALASAVAPLLAERQNQACSKLHLMVSGGCALPCSVDSLGLLSTTVSNITAAIPDTDLYMVPYDGSEFQAAVSTPILEQAVNQYTSDCPNTPIVLVGYSLGGIIVTNTLCGGISYNPNVIGSITYGEETRVYPESYDRGSCVHSAPKYARSNPGACAPFAPIMRSYCDYGDPQCCEGGFIPAQHFEYAAKYDLDALAFIESQYEAFTKTNLSTSSSSTSTSSMSTSSSTSTTSSSMNPAPYQPVMTYSSIYYSNSSMTSSTVSAHASSTVTESVGFTATDSSATAVSTAVSTAVQGTYYSTMTSMVAGSPTTITLVVTRTTTTIPTYTASDLTTPSIPTTGSLTSGLIPLTGVVYPSSIPSKYQYLTSSVVIVATTVYPAMSASSVGDMTVYPTMAASSVGDTTVYPEISASSVGDTTVNPAISASSVGDTTVYPKISASSVGDTTPYPTMSYATSPSGPTTAYPTMSYATSPSSAVTPPSTNPGLTPFSPNGGSSLAISASVLIPCIILAWSFLI